MPTNGEVEMLAALAVATALGAQDDPQACARISDDDERLRCYDLVHRVETERVPTVQSDWTVRVDRSRLDDSTSVFMYVGSDEPHINRFGQRENLTLHIRCLENTTALYIHFGGAFMASGARDYVTVDYRVDDRAPRERRFYESNNNQALGLWRGNQSIPFIQELFGGNALYVRAVPFSDSAIDGEFNIAGLEEEIAPLREACNW